MNSDEYRNLIDRAIRDGSGEPILNGSHAHATVIVERMFAHAKETMRILTRKFDPRIYGTTDTVEQAKLFLGDPNRKCKILIEQISPEALDTHPFMEEMSPFLASGNLQICQVPKFARELINVNFAVMDERGFRFEEDKTEAVALAVFGGAGSKLTTSLRVLYDKIWTLSESHPLPQRDMA